VPAFVRPDTAYRGTSNHVLLVHAALRHHAPGDNQVSAADRGVALLQRGLAIDYAVCPARDNSFRRVALLVCGRCHCLSAQRRDHNRASAPHRASMNGDQRSCNPCSWARGNAAGPRRRSGATGYPVGPRPIERVLKDRDYALHWNRKERESRAGHPGRKEPTARFATQHWPPPPQKPR